MIEWVGAFCLAICALPQAWHSYTHKNSDGLTWGFLALWAIGEICLLIYVISLIDWALIVNYAANLALLGVIIYYKVWPKITIIERVYQAKAGEPIKTGMPVTISQADGKVYNTKPGEYPMGRNLPDDYRR